jgi:hypothetical protein
MRTRDIHLTTFSRVAAEWGEGEESEKEETACTEFNGRFVN